MKKPYEYFTEREYLMRLDKTLLVNIVIDQNKRLEIARNEWKRMNNIIKART